MIISITCKRYATLSFNHLLVTLSSNEERKTARTVLSQHSRSKITSMTSTKQHEAVCFNSFKNVLGDPPLTYKFYVR